jgi:hypothetical protein
MGRVIGQRSNQSGLGVVSGDNCNNVWLAGGTSTTSTSINFSGHIIPIVPGWDPAFVARYSGSGSFDTAYMLASGGDDYLFVKADNKGGFFLGGDYNNSPLYFGSEYLIVRNRNVGRIIPRQIQI